MHQTITALHKHHPAVMKQRIATKSFFVADAYMLLQHCCQEVQPTFRQHNMLHHQDHHSHESLPSIFLALLMETNGVDHVAEGLHRWL
jgi:hypothetical protein